MRFRFAITAIMIFFPFYILAATSVSQPYRPLNVSQQWTIEGQEYGMLKVRIIINGQVVADGPMKTASFNADYNKRTIRTICAIGSGRMTGPADRSCSVYVDDELAANLIFVRRP